MQKNTSKTIWKSSTAWWVTLFMGIQSLLFYSLVAWLPTIVTFKGLSVSFSSQIALTLQLFSIPTTLIIPLICGKLKNQRGLSVIVTTVYLTGMLLLFIGNTQAILIVSAILLALGIGGSISLAITFISFRTPNAGRAAQLSGMSQSAGYIFAATGPTFLGAIFDMQNSWNIPIIILIVLIVCLCVCGLFAGKDILVED